MAGWFRRQQISYKKWTVLEKWPSGHVLMDGPSSHVPMDGPSGLYGGSDYRYSPFMFIRVDKKQVEWMDLQLMGKTVICSIAYKP
jgi:hypothetical protein